MLCSETRLAAFRASVFGYPAMDLNPLGTWIRCGWLHAGEDRFLDDALSYTFQSMLSYRHRDCVAQTQVSAAGHRAVQSLRFAVNSYNSYGDPQNLIIAITLHYAAAQFHDLGSFDYVPHIYAVSHLLSTSRERTIDTEILDSIVGNICEDEVSTDCYVGNNIVFKSWLGYQFDPSRPAVITEADTFDLASSGEAARHRNSAHCRRYSYGSTSSIDLPRKSRHRSSTQGAGSPKCD
jgi:hypothetical protein